MEYIKIFDPDSFDSGNQPAPASQHSLTCLDSGGFADHDSVVHKFEEETILAINMALATARPLLVRGPTGCGKSSLARAVAKIMNRHFDVASITSRSEARDLHYQVDLVTRLADAQASVSNSDLVKRVADIGNYITPGVLWWAFDPDDAEKFVKEHDTKEHGTFISQRDPEKEGSVVLLDEIDKADPDFANNLLTTLSNLRFKVLEVNRDVEVKRPQADISLKEAVKHYPLIVITTNEEQELPSAFQRRCIDIRLKPLTKADELEAIAKLHFGEEQGERNVYKVIAEKVAKLITGAKSGERKPSTAEFLDVVRIALRLASESGRTLTEQPEVWEIIQNSALRKNSSQDQ